MNILAFIQTIDGKINSNSLEALAAGQKISKKTNEELFDIYVDMKTTLQHNIDLINKYDIHKNLTQRIFNE